jgi:energy-coupling factor transporter ATP-binding protein EcfA2
MTLINGIIASLVAGVKATQPPLADAVIRHLYDEIKRFLGAHYPTVDLLALERRPDSPAKQGSLAEDLVDAGAMSDPTFTALISRLAQALVESNDAPRVIGVDLEHIRAATLTLSDIAGADMAVRLRDGTFTGDVAIHGATAGQPGATAPLPPTVQLVGNQARDIHIGNKTYLGDDANALDLAEVEQRYLRGLYAECNELLLANDGPVDATRQRQPRLQHVYVDLETTGEVTIEQVLDRLQVPAQQRTEVKNRLLDWQRNLNTLAVGIIGSVPKRLNASMSEEVFFELATELGLPKDTIRKAIVDPLTVREALYAHPQLVFLGDPGSGKSTLTRRLAGLLASQAVPGRDAAEAQWLDELVQGWGRWLLPVRIVLSRWAQHLAPTAQGTAADLVDECVRLLGQTAGVRGLQEHFITRLTAAPPTALILLDGLDEVADESKRATLLKAVKHFRERYSAVPLLITCRVRPWQAWTTAGKALPLPVFTIDQLTQEAITAFVERWHIELIQAGRYTPAAAAIAQRRLLTALANRQRKDLADMARTPLLLTMMARVNYQQGLPDSRAELYDVYLRQLLWEWERQKLDDQGQPTGLQLLLAQGNVDEASLERKLAQLAYEVHGRDGTQDTVDISRGTVREALEAIHPGSEEAKAAWAVAMLRLLDDRSGLLQSLDGATYQFSHRTFQEFLAARWIATGDFRKKYREKIDQEGWREAIALALGYQIRVLRQYEDALSVLFALFPTTATDEAAWRRVLLLGEAYVRLLGRQRARESEQVEMAAMLATRVPQQLTAAMHQRTLPPTQRRAAGQLLAELDIDPPGLDDFVSAPGWNFKIGRYPVTNKQFRRFVDAGGYRDERWWSDTKGRQARDERDWTEPRFWNQPELNWPTQPVVGVSWYEAQAYCAWLTHELRQQGKLTEQMAVRLPTQAEWEAAACSHDGRAYPWGQTFELANANTAESDLGQTTPVDLYSDGVTPEGVWDLLGNVWEWTNDVDEDGWPLLRGLSYYNEADTAAAADGYRPDLRSYVYGFRCVVVPISR